MGGRHKINGVSQFSMSNKLDMCRVLDKVKKGNKCKGKLKAVGVADLPQPAPILVAANKACSGRMKDIGPKAHHGFGHTLMSCAESVAADDDCRNGFYHWAANYGGQCKCALDACDKRQNTAHSSIYTINGEWPPPAKFIGSNKFCNGPTKPMAGLPGFGFDAQSCADVVFILQEWILLPQSQLQRAVQMLHGSMQSLHKTKW